MGGGPTKEHESFTVAPTAATSAATAPPTPAPVPAPPPVKVPVTPPSVVKATPNTYVFGSGGSGPQGPGPGQGDDYGVHDDTDAYDDDGDDDGDDETYVVEPYGDAGIHAIDDHAGGDLEAGPGPASLEAEGPVPEAEAAKDALVAAMPGMETGNVTGTPMLVGGDDLNDSLATLVSYGGEGGPREVLMATVNEEAEAKLLEAVSLSETKMVPVQIEKEVHGRLPKDEAAKLYEEMVIAAKSTNHHLKAGDGIPDHTKQRLADVYTKLDDIEKAGPTDAEQKMVDHYRAHADQINDRFAPGYAVAYTEGGKIPTVTPFETSGTTTVTEYIAAPNEGPGDGQLPATVRNATRVKPTLAEDGTASWNGTDRSQGIGKEYVVDLGDGYSAVYRPYAVNQPSASSQYSLRGALEVVAPPGAGHGPELVDRLGQLNLVNRPMSPQEGEWTYLKRNIDAQGLGSNPGVQKALAETKGVEDAMEHVLFAERAHEAIGMDDHQLRGLAKQIRLDAERTGLRAKVSSVRDAVAKATGHANGDALAASAGYDPTPRRSGGWLAWGRFDVTGNSALRKAFGSRGLHHTVGRGDLVTIMRTGVLASTERRARMGVRPDIGQSEGPDKISGGANHVFLRVQNDSGGKNSMFWDDPTPIVGRSDWYAYQGDHFGALNPKSHHSLSGQTKDPKVVAGWNGCNELMVGNGLDLFGAEAPSVVRCKSEAQRKEVLKVLHEKGVTHVRGKPVNEWVK